METVGGKFEIKILEKFPTNFAEKDLNRNVHGIQSDFRGYSGAFQCIPEAFQWSFYERYTCVSGDFSNFSKGAQARFMGVTWGSPGVLGISVPF